MARWQHRLRLRLRSLLRRRRVDDELSRELQFCLDQQIAENVESGMSPEDARFAALRTMGSLTHLAEQCRDARGMHPVDDIRRDLSYALRAFGRNPVFTATALLTLAIGIGATTTVFSVVRGVLLQPLPFRDADRLVRIVENVPAEESMTGRAMRLGSMNQEELAWWRQETRTLSHMAATMPDFRTIVTPQGAERLAGARVSPALFAMRGVQPVIGRWLRAEEERPGANVVVLSQDVWRRYFGSSRGIANRTVVLDGQVHSVVGVMPPEFGPEAYWMPYAIEMRPGAVIFVAVISRLADGVSLEQAAAEANALGYRLRGVPPPLAGGEAGVPRRFEVVRELDAVVGAVRPALRILIAAVAVVLLIVCANVANLLMTRGAGRIREIATRRALGATRVRIFRQLLVESAILSAAGGAAGCALAYAGVNLIRAWGVAEVPQRFRGALGRLGPAVFPRIDEVSLDAAVLMFTLALTIVTGLVFGIVPAFRLSRIDPRDAGHRTSVSSYARVGAATVRPGQLLATGQLAMATGLLVGAGLLMHSFLRLSSVPLGFDPGAYAFQLVMPGEYSPARRMSIAYDVAGRLRRLPGVQDAGFTNEMPLEGTMFDPDETLVPTDWDGDRSALGNEDRSDTRMVSPGYLQALGARLVEGRWLDDRDDASAPRVLLVNRAWVRRYSPDRSPIGRRVDNVVAFRRPGAPRFPWVVVGVVDDVRVRIGETPSGTGDLIVFMDLRQSLGRNAESLLNRPGPPNMEIQMAFGFSNGLGYALRVDGTPPTIPQLRAAVREVDGALAVDGLTTMGDVFSGVIGRQRFQAVIVAAFGMAAGLIAAVGIFGVLAWTVSRRTQELGVRLALGGTPRTVLTLVLRQGLTMTVFGVGIGVAAAAALSEYLSGLLFGVTRLDPATYAVVALACGAVAMCASYVPARRATLIDPVLALRHD